METVTTARRGRKRKDIPVSNPVGEGEESSSLDVGNWQVSGAGVAAPSDAVRQGEGWDSFVDRVIELHRTTRWQVRQVWHPRPKQDVIKHDNGSIVVSSGEQKAYLASGEYVEI